MSKPHRSLGILALCLSLAGCSISINPSASQAPANGPSGIVSSFATSFSSADWSSVRAEFTNQRLADSLVRRMELWRSELVQGLKARIIYRTPPRGGSFVGTVEFRADPRAIPMYAIYTFHGTGRNTRVTGSVTGITGTNYQNASWSVTRSAHFVFYHSPYELKGVDKRFIAGLEYQRRQFIRRFGIHPAPLARYYWYPRQSMMGPFTHDACGSSPDLVGCADPGTHPPTIQTSEWPTYHEPVHIYQASMEPPKHVAPLFIAEGMAVALEDRQLDPRLSDYCSDLSYVPLDSCAQQAAHTLKARNILSDSGFNHADPGNAYLLAGSFVKYLILRFGYHSFGKFYYALAAQPRDRVTDYNVATGSAYHRSITALLADWNGNLCGSGDC